MFYKLRLIISLFTMAFISILLIGCGGNDDTTNPDTPTIPVLTTSAVSAITQTTAESGGNVTSDGGAAVTVRGVCWDTSATPEITDNSTSDGSGTGSFTSSLTGLTAGTPYYIRAYATNSAGTGYGNILPFTTVALSGTGTIIVDPFPDDLNAPWSLAGPNSYSTSGTGDDTLTELLPGDYEITWENVTGWITPSDSTQTLAEDETVTFTGIYVDEGGFDSTGTVTDFDGNVYQTIKIGDQWWMMENLKVTHYCNGDPIPHVTENSGWSSISTGAYCEYDNDSSLVATYGRLYNWYAVNDNRGLAPLGWHVPTDVEWKQLEMYLGMSQSEADTTSWRGTDEGGKLKEAGTTHWGSPNTGATNESGFTGLPGGYRSYNGTFYNKIFFASFWSSTEGGGYFAWYRGLYYDKAKIDRSYHDKPSGISVRCVKD